MNLPKWLAEMRDFENKRTLVAGGPELDFVNRFDRGFNVSSEILLAEVKVLIDALEHESRPLPLETDPGLTIEDALLEFAERIGHTRNVLARWKEKFPNE